MDITQNDGVGGGGDSINEVIGQGNDSQSDFIFVSMSESTIAAISQNCYTDKNVKMRSESEIAAITQAAKVGIVSTEVVGDEQSIKDVCLNNITINTVVTGQNREDMLPQGGDTESTNTGNESVDGGLAKGSKFVIAPPPEDIARPQAGKLADEVPAKVEDNVEDCGVGPSKASGRDSDFEEETSDFVIPPRMNVVDINDDQTTHVASRRGRPRRSAKAKKSPFVPGSGLSELGETPLKPVNGSPKYSIATQEATESYRVLLPLFLNTVEFYTVRNDIVFENGLHRGHQLSDPLDVIMIEKLPKQSNTYGILLWHYGSQNQENCECNDSENPGW
ncbi:hypothetical protein RND71_002487 [Anisodus tanguticus]|uniref:Uncharacterized protein n=1 Tax=Anisodus tanguticus TaxID=243964 RepID=A0AAE1T1Y9_9SOLA|nr:hypothetical protein RND71_002487 [Anisodus tanguticus]